jgi:hypothetical protein
MKIITVYQIMIGVVFVLTFLLFVGFGMYWYTNKPLSIMMAIWGISHLSYMIFLINHCQNLTEPNRVI